MHYVYKMINAPQNQKYFFSSGLKKIFLWLFSSRNHDTVTQDKILQNPDLLILSFGGANFLKNKIKNKFK